MKSQGVPALWLSVALASFAFPLYAFLRWLNVFDKAAEFGENVTRFLDGFPGPIRDAFTITVISSACCAVAAAAGVVAFRRATGPPRGAIGLLVGLAALMGLWNLFTLM